MSDNSRITIILAVAMALAVIFSVLLFVYLFYRAQTHRVQDAEALQKSHQASVFNSKPLPPIPYPEETRPRPSPPQPSAVNRRSPPSLLQRRQATHPKNGALPLRDLQLDPALQPRREPENDDQQDAREQLGNISIGFSPDVGNVPFQPTPRGPRLSQETISRLRDSRPRPHIGKHLWEAVPEEDSPDLADMTMSSNKI